MTNAEKRRSGRRARPAAGAAVLALVAGGAGFAVAGGDGEAAPERLSTATATTTIKRQDLVETDTVDGTLGYSDERTVINRLPGTVTWTPDAGDVVRINRPLYEVDGRAVYLLDGTYPAYRTLTAGLTGDDVRQLERNLRALGLDKDREMRVDGTWDAGTTAAVLDWQRSKALEETGSIEFGRVVFQPRRRRVATVSEATEAPPAPAAPADPAAQQSAPALMTTTSTRRIVTGDLETTQFELAERGASVRVEMPDGEKVGGRIMRVGRVAEAVPASAEDTDPTPTVELTIRLKRRSSGVGVDQAPVDVDLEKQRARDVLTIPVTALLARQGGSLAVEVREGDRRRIVPVETGLYTDGYVEITGPGLRAGMTVTDARV
jgi:peptidoglycan hydrolase-like protein with peptidoglycan-binding domain